MKESWIAILFLAVVLPATLHAQATGRVQLFGHLFIDHGVTGGNYYSNCWGYTDPNGREYALMGAVTGLSIVDITHADSIREVAFIRGVTSGWREIKTHSHYAYVVTDVTSFPDSLLGTHIIDLSELPDTARLVRRWVHTSGTRNTKLAHTISIHDGYLYLNGCQNWSPQSVLIFSLADPVNPTYVGEWGSEYIHDSMADGNLLFAAAIYSPGGLNIVNITNRSNPQFVTKITYPGAGTHNAWTTPDRNYVVTTDEIGSTPKTLKVWDIRSLPQWSSVSEFTVDPSATVHNVHIKGRYAYVAWYPAGAHVVDLMNPAQPVHTGGYDTFPGTPTSPYNGCWGVYPYYNSNKFIASDRQTGLYVLELDTTATGVVRSTGQIPDRFALDQNFPNPFNPETRMQYSIPSAGRVVLTVTDILGREVATLVDEHQSAGTYTTWFTAEGNATGVYLARLAFSPATGEGGTLVSTRKMVIVR